MKCKRRALVLLFCCCAVVVVLCIFQMPSDVVTLQFIPSGDHISAVRHDLDVSEHSEEKVLPDNEVQLRDLLNDEALKRPKNLIKLKSFLQNIRSDKGYKEKKMELDLLINSVASYLKKKKIRRRAPSQPLNLHQSEQKLENWQKFHNNINGYSLYEEDNVHIIKALIHDMEMQMIDDMEQKEGGTQLKLTFYLNDGSKAIFKPMRFPREQSDTWPDHFYFSDFERFFSEIASFHLDKLLGFRRVVPVTGRIINVTSEVEELAETPLKKTFFTSPAGNRCFHGHCDYYCTTGFAVCGHPYLLQGSMISYLPSSKLLPRSVWRHPYRRSYHKRKKAPWEIDPDYCESLKKEEPYKSGRRLADLMDLAIFDFLIGNMDRHHYETFEAFGNFTFLVALDNGRGFGKSSRDELSILAPLSQCCIVRISTLSRLLSFHQSPTPLSARLQASLAADATRPVLLERHLLALDRRLAIILQTVQTCIRNSLDVEDVLVNDGF